LFQPLVHTMLLVLNQNLEAKNGGNVETAVK
jgi:hypothetical protein